MLPEDFEDVEDFTEIPVIDIAPLLADDHPERAATVARLGDAARRVGFAQLIGHGIEPAVFERLLDATRRFFALPLAEKMRCYIGDSTNHRGYVPIGEEVFAGGTPDHKEAFDLSFELPADDPRHRAGNPLLGPNRWPDLANFREPVTAYYEAVFGLARLVLRAFAQTLGEAPDRFDRHVTAPPAQLRLIHYPFDASAQDRPGIGAHTDYECFTLLRPTTGGLEVMNRAGDWLPVPFVEDALVLNIGDLLELWTNGEFTATTHRVRRVPAERYSFPLFFTVDYDTPVAPLPAFVTPERPAQPPLLSGEHLFAQTAQSFRYLRERLETGSLTLPEGSRPLASFGQEARTRSAAGTG
ncbi:isopenicillin N synthase family dioxygenase [Streptomyces triticirhizae]|uniref:Isopenicillin N synthase family oxygenase n=1 Tax=Streptomyces triticirhizae TaxID=2483353 RepID=A0A3M2LR68_9ACTN|nr:2-oxoglutarate and iron-dependent oxygenase domain-containing protein [Streptomyces triticirhizae]RMI38585.1 isopenicillin N synthase family oxygenase [Streptomyces triticirhizae]